MTSNVQSLVNKPPRFQKRWLIGLLAIWLGVGLVPKWLDSNPGTFGDMFGMVNSLFSGLAFLGLIHTIRLQMHEISLQRQELEWTRDEITRSADAQKASADALALQVIISAISAQISTALERRATARRNELDLIQRQRSMIELREVENIQSEIDKMRRGYLDLTKEIDSLSERLREYDQRLCESLKHSQEALSERSSTDSPPNEGL